jgi:phosphatidylglycerophosphate synthase
MSENSKTHFTIQEIDDVFHDREPWTNVLVLKPLIITLAYLVLNFTRLRPNSITTASCLLGAAAAVAYFNNEMWIGAGLFISSYLFDAIDGKVARLKNLSSPFGALYDILVDRAIMSLLIISLAFNEYVLHKDVMIFVQSCFFLGLFLVGSESQHYLKARTQSDSGRVRVATAGESATDLMLEENTGLLSRYSLWAKDKGLVALPIGLVEVLFISVVIGPLAGNFHFGLIVANIFLLARLILSVYSAKKADGNSPS